MTHSRAHSHPASGGRHLEEEDSDEEERRVSDHFSLPGPSGRAVGVSLEPLEQVLLELLEPGQQEELQEELLELLHEVGQEEEQQQLVEVREEVEAVLLSGEQFWVGEMRILFGAFLPTFSLFSVAQCHSVTVSQCHSVRVESLN